MTQKSKYSKVIEKMTVSVAQAQRAYMLSGSSRDKEYYEYKKMRLERFKEA